MNCHYSPLEQESLLHLSGPDALTFLQGQTTCDTRKLDAQHSLPGIYCTPQGRVVCDFLLTQLGDLHFTLRMRRDIRAGSSATFGKYIIFSKATLEAEREDWQVLALWGEDASAAIRQLVGAVPDQQYACVSDAVSCAIQVDGEGRQFECYVNNASGAQWQAQLAELAGAGSAQDWNALQVASGIARIEAATVEEFVPQTLNYDLTGHISFDKGCYTGQEVVARLHYRGTPKRRMYLATLPDGATGAAAGTPVYSSEKEQSVGNIVNCADPQGQATVLVTATDSGIEQGLHLGSDDGPLLQIGELPYPVQAQG